MANDDVIQDRDVEHFPSFNQQFGDLDVLRLGSGSPLGWLCATMMLAALWRTASRNTSLAPTTLVLSVPT